MKKKGLIISTVVMVIVLIASLTTATYAWFTSSNQVSVQSITMQVGEGAEVMIGAKINNTYAANVTADDFMFGAVTWTPATDDTTLTNGTWTGGQTGLSTSLNTGVSFNSISKAVSTGTLADGGTVDAAWDTSHQVIKANGNGDHTTIEAGSIEAAAANDRVGADTSGDYFSIVMGVQAAASNLTGISCVVTIDPTDSKTTIGMNAAIHVRYRVDGGEWEDKDVYGADRYNKTKTGIATDNAASLENLNSGAQSLTIPVAALVGEEQNLSTETINQLELIIFIDGNDPDCIDAARGSQATIHINFITTKAAVDVEP